MDTELCATNSLLIGGHREVIMEFNQREALVTETELGQTDGITPQATLYWDGLNHFASEQ